MRFLGTAHSVSVKAEEIQGRYPGWARMRGWLVLLSAAIMAVDSLPTSPRGGQIMPCRFGCPRLLLMQRLRGGAEGRSEDKNHDQHDAIDGLEEPSTASYSEATAHRPRSASHQDASDSTLGTPRTEKRLAREVLKRDLGAIDSLLSSLSKGAIRSKVFADWDQFSEPTSPFITGGTATGGRHGTSHKIILFLHARLGRASQGCMHPLPSHLRVTI